jgi:T3SS negative regulator,GrlR
MLENGKYSAWFRTPLGEGTGVVVLKDGKITGGDTVIAYTGSCNQVGDEFTADISTKRHTPGQLSVFGIDKIDLKLTGKSTGTMATCRGTSRQAPGMTFEATIIRIAE